jgi:amino acid transporter
MAQSLEAKYYIIPFLIIATYGLIYTRKADLKPHSRVKLNSTVVLLYLGAVLTFGSAYIDQKLFGKLMLYAGAIWVIQMFLVPNSWIDKKYYKWKKNHQANDKQDKLK